MDELVNDQLMTDCERESIVQESTSRRRKEAFLCLMKGRLSHDTLINNFIPAIQLDHPRVAAKLKETALELEQSPPMFSVCAVCNTKQTVQVKYIAEHLHTNGIIPTDLYEEFRSSRSNNASKWTTLTARVPNPNHITEAVKCKFPVVYDHLKRENSTDLSCKCLERRAHEFACARDDSIDTEATVDVANVSDLESMLGTSISASSTSPESLEEYTMRSIVKGHAILINNKASNPSKNIQKFYDLDIRKLALLLTQNGFQTKVLTNLTAKEMRLVLQRFANLNHSAYDAFVCVIHCEMDTRDKKVFLLDADCKPLLFEEIKDMFKASRCPTLAGKPKIFFLPSGDRKNSMKGHSNVPDEADFLIVRATAPGYEVFGNRAYNGSLWVSVFHNIFQRYSESLDFLSLLTLVASQVGYFSTGILTSQKQGPHVESTLRKMLILRSPTDKPDDQDQVPTNNHIAFNTGSSLNYHMIWPLLLFANVYNSAFANPFY